jgi:hypothetical protein
LDFGNFKLAPVFIKVREAFVKAKQKTNAVELLGRVVRLFIKSCCLQVLAFAIRRLTGFS